MCCYVSISPQEHTDTHTQEKEGKVKRSFHVTNFNSILSLCYMSQIPSNKKKRWKNINKKTTKQFISISACILLFFFIHPIHFFLEIIIQRLTGELNVRHFIRGRKGNTQKVFRFL